MNKKFSIKKDGIVIEKEDLVDPILRCDNCSTINYSHDLQDNGGCKKCPCIKFKRVIGITDKEFDMLKTDKIVSEKFLAEFIDNDKFIEERKKKIQAMRRTTNG